MPEEDWLKDPLMEIGELTYHYIKPADTEAESYKSWMTFHFDTRLKLNGADYFLRQVLGSVSRPDNIGAPLLAYNFRQWYLDAFFFELMAAYEMLLQELNALYECGVDISDLRLFNKLKSKLPVDLFTLLDEEREKEWLIKLKTYRNLAAHCHHNITDTSTLYVGDEPWNYHEYKVTLRLYNEDTNNWDIENIKICETYFNQMVNHINEIWNKIKDQRFSSIS